MEEINLLFKIMPSGLIWFEFICISALLFTLWYMAKESFVYGEEHMMLKGVRFFASGLLFTVWFSLGLVYLIFMTL